MTQEATPVNPSQSDDACDDVNRMQTSHAVVDAEENFNIVAQ